MVDVMDETSDRDLDLVLAACAWYDAHNEGNVEAPLAMEALKSLKDEILELRLTVAYYEERS